MQSSKGDVLRDLGQLFIIGLDGPTLPNDVAEFLRAFRIGGVILFEHNYEDVHQLRTLTTHLRQRCCISGQPLFIAVDHEGGRVQRFVRGFTKVEPMATYGSRSPEQTEKIHQIVAGELDSVGINLDFAPVADLCTAEMAGSIGSRSFGTDAQRVSRHVAAAIRGLRSGAVLTCAKHFPGQGETIKDSHHELPVIQADRTTMENRELVPFRAAIAAGVDAVMTAHAVYPSAGEPDLPASMSPFWIGDVLRRRLGFDGLVITDSLEMQAVTEFGNRAECGCQALRAGTDIVLYHREASQFDAFMEIRRAFANGELDSSCIAGSLERVRKAKQNLRH